jgi:hypothetical protein
MESGANGVGHMKRDGKGDASGSFTTVLVGFLFISDSSGNPRAGQGRTGKAIVNYVKVVRPAHPDAAVLITTGDTGRGLVRILGGTSESPAACFLHVFFFHPGKPPRSPTDEDEGDRDMTLNTYGDLSPGPGPRWACVPEGRPGTAARSIPKISFFKTGTLGKPENLGV